MIILIGIFSMIRIPKESMPEIQFGIISITTLYPGGSPEDIDTLISEKITDKIKNLEGIDKITATATDSVSNIIVQLKNDTNASDLSTKIQDAIKQLSLPEEAKDPIVSELDTKTSGKVMFDLILYSQDTNLSPQALRAKADTLKQALEGKWSIDTIVIWGGWDYQVEVLFDQHKLETLGLSLPYLANLIQSYNSNQPLGTHTVDTMEYSFRLEGELKNIQQLKSLSIPLKNGRTIALEQLATIKISYDQESDLSIGTTDIIPHAIGKQAINLTFNKSSGSSILSASKESKKLIEAELQKSNYQGIKSFYTLDLGEILREDYTDLAINMITTLMIVFAIVWLFVGGIESFLATISIPLAFFITFFVLNSLGYTMNFLTNFSLIICLGIAVDTATVIIQGASENIKLWYRPLYAALLAVKTYKNSLISGTATTVVVFLPMMSLPGVMWAFLAYIPITIFITLIASLLISLTITPTLFFKITNNPRYYQKNPDSEVLLSPELQILLEEERKNKSELNTQTTEQQSSRNQKLLTRLNQRYAKRSNQVLKNAHNRIIMILIPLIIFLGTVIFVSPNIGFIMMPAADNEYLSISLEWKAWLDQNITKKQLPDINTLLSPLPELKNYVTKVENNTITVTIRILPQSERTRSSFEIENELAEKFRIFTTRGFQVTVKVDKDWPQWWSTIGIKLLAENSSQLDTLTKVARDFKEYLESLPGTKNVKSSSEEGAWQFVFQLNKEKLALLNLTPKMLAPELYLALNGLQAGSIKSEDENYDITLKYANFMDQMSADQLLNTVITTPAGKITLGTLWDYVFKPAISSISREEGDITITIGSDLQKNIKAEVINAQLYTFAEKYKFPAGISYEKGGEKEENADLLIAIIGAFVFSLIIIFAILVLQFNSYSQPLIISYSILMGFTGATYGMIITWNSYSMMFMIGFVALTGIVVNNAIILIDTANENQKHWESREQAIKESAKSRLKPILSTTLTTVIWLSTLTSDGFFAPLAYTIMFGLSIATVMTLFSVPALYHDQEKLKLLIKRIGIKPMLLIFAIILILGCCYLISILMRISLWENLYTKTAALALLISGMIFLIGSELKALRSGQASRRQKMTHLQTYSTNTNTFTRKKIRKRILLKFWLFLSPIAIGLIGSRLLQGLWISPELAIQANIILITLGYLFYIGGNLYSFWTSKDNQFLHDLWTETGVRDTKTNHQEKSDF